MPGKQKGNLSVLWMPRKRKHNHHNKVSSREKNYKVGKTRTGFDMSGPGAIDSSRLSDKPPQDHLMRNSIDTLPLGSKITHGLENPGTSATKLENELENLSLNETNTEENKDCLEKSEGSCDDDNSEKPKKTDDDSVVDDDNKEEDGLGFRCLYYTCQCCECIVS